MRALVAVNPQPISYFDVSTISASAATLALAAIGETIVILAGGLDLSAGAVISLVNVVLVTQLGTAELGVVPYTRAATRSRSGIGAGIGALNGFLVGYLRLQSIVVDAGHHVHLPGGGACSSCDIPAARSPTISRSSSSATCMPELLPAPIVVMAIAVLVWLFLSTRGSASRSTPSAATPTAAAYNRVDVAAHPLHGPSRIAGAFFGAAGLVRHRQYRLRRPADRRDDAPEDLRRGGARRHA